MSTAEPFPLPDPVLPVIVLDDLAHAVPLAHALIAGGMTGMEITFRTPAAADAIAAVREGVPQMKVGAGTLLTTDQARAALDAGAQFGVAPGLHADVLEVFQEAAVPFLPGVMTPTEVTRALNLGCRDLKFFPAESAGGVAMLQAMMGPFAGEGLRLCPTGGIGPGNLNQYLALPSVHAVGGSWIASRQDIATGDFGAITGRARQALAAASTNAEGTS